MVAQRHDVFGRSECAAQGWLDSEQREIGLRNEFAGNAFRVVDAGERELVVAIGGDGCERTVLTAPVAIIGIRSAAPLYADALDVAPQDHEARGLGVGHGAQYGGIHYREDRGVCADA